MKVERSTAELTERRSKTTFKVERKFESKVNSGEIEGKVNSGRQS